MAMQRTLFKACGQNVTIAEDAFIEHPECLEIGDNVVIMRGFHMLGAPRRCRFGDKVTFYPNCVVTGSPDRFLVDHHVTFLTGTHIALGDAASFVEIGHTSHFAPYCVLYGWGGLTIGPYANIAAHTVFATIGHDYTVKDQPMALAPPKRGPIVLEEDVWIGANVTVTANTRIAKGCVIAANAALTKDTEPDGIYAGVPAKRIRNRNQGS